MACRSHIWVVIVASYFFISHGANAIHASSIVLSSTYHVMEKRSLGTLNDQFLSYTLEPEVLTHIADCGETNETTNLIQALLPAYLRIAGPDSKKLLFQNQPSERTNITAGNNAENRKQDNVIVTGPQWLKFIKFVKNNTGLRIVVSLNGNFEREYTNLDLTNALEFITFSSKHNLDLDWELGYEFQRMSNHDGRALGRDVTKLRKVLDIFPHYRKSLILGPDMTSLENRADVAFIQGYLSEAGDSLNAFTLHYDFSNLKEDEDIFEKLSPLFNRMDTYLWNKEGVLKSVAKGVVDKKSIWLSESERKENFCSFSDTLSFVQRLGAAARLGVSVYLRRPHLISLTQPTSEYWAAVLFKSLVGKTVLDVRYIEGNNTKVFAFGHCTRILQRPEDSIINPNVAYRPGAITLYGVNSGSEWSRFFFKLSSRYEQTIHLYVLNEDKGSYSTRTLFNRQELRLSADGELPIVFPKIREYAKYVVLPPKSIFFVVLPYANSRSCMSSSSADESSFVAKKKNSPISSENSTNAVDLVGILEEDESDDGAVYVSYAKKQERSTSLPVPALKTIPSENTKFITYSEETWLSPLPSQLKEIYYRGPARISDDATTPPHTKKEKRVSKIDNYRVITQALLGKRNVSQNVSEEPFSRSMRSVDAYLEDPDEEVTKDEDGVYETLDVDVSECDVGDNEQTDGQESNIHIRRRRDTISTTMTSPPPSNVEDLSNYDSEYSVENVRLSREISANASSSFNNNPYTQPPHNGLPPRKHRKGKLSDEWVLSSHSTSGTPEASVMSHSPLDTNQTPASIDVTESSSSSTPALDFAKSVTLASETLEHAPEITTIITETTTTVDVPRGARSMDEGETAEPVNETVQKPEHAASKPRQKTTKGRPAGYISSTTTMPTSSATKHSRRIRVHRNRSTSTTPAPPASTAATKRRRIAKFTTAEPMTSFATRRRPIKPNNDHGMRSADTLPKLIETTHAKLKEIVDTNRAKIQTLKDERMQRRQSGNPRSKREVVQDTHELGTSLHPAHVTSNLDCQPSDGRSAANDVTDKARDVCKDLGDNAKDVYSDVSHNVRDKLYSLSGWMREKYSEIKKELVATRSMQDVLEVRKHIRDYSAKIQKELADIRERLRSRPKASARRSAQQLPEGKYSENDMNMTPQQHEHHYSIVPEAATNEGHEVLPTPSPSTMWHHHGNPSDLLISSRPARSIETNEIVDDSDLNWPVDDNPKNAYDHFETNMVDTKLRGVASHSETKTAVAANSPDHAVTKGVHIWRGDGVLKSYSDVPSDDDVIDEDQICDRNANVLAYVWCRCRSFLVVMIRLFNNDNRKN